MTRPRAADSSAACPCPAPRCALLSSGEIWQHRAISGWRADIGFAIGGGIGLLLGFVTSLSKWGERLLGSSAITTRSVKDLELAVGSEVIAFVKSTEVSIAKR